MNRTRNTGDWNGESRPFLTSRRTSKPLLHYKRGLLILQKGFVCIVKGACLHCKRGLLTAKMRLYEAIFIAHFRAKRHTSHIVRRLRLHAQNSQKTHWRFSDGFFASFERQENANIVSHKGEGVRNSIAKLWLFH